MIDSRGPLYIPTGIIAAVLLMALSLLLTIQMLRTLLGPFQFEQPQQVSDREYFGIWRIDGGSEAVGAPSFALRLAAWRRLIASVVHCDGEIPVSASLAELTSLPVKVVVVASGRSMTLSQTQALKSFVEAGGGAVVAGSLGVRDKEGKWLGYHVMRQLLDVSQIAPILEDTAAFVRAGNRGGILASPFSPNERLPLIPERGVPSLMGVDSELIWIVAPASAPGSYVGASASAQQAKILGASRRLSLGAGRLVWLGPGPESNAEAGREDWNTGVQIYRSALLWVGRKPFVSLRAWPDGLEEGPLEDPRANLRWIEQQPQVRVAFAIVGPHRLRIDVSNRSAYQLRGAILRVFFNRKIEGQVHVAATTLGQGTPTFETSQADQWTDIRLPRISSGLNRTYTVDTPGLAWE